ncbi:MAG TPA: hypothetical protein VGG72_09940 [Bryobacteraceae bacterium]|jgi:hypothetical protein
MRLLALAAAASLAFGQGPGPAACDRTCLEAFVNQYLDALVAHNPFGMPLARKVKFSENEVVLDLGDGVWNTITGAGTYKLYVADPQSGQVGFFGTMRENSTPIALAARLKIENRKISEIETVINRGGGGPPRGGGPAPEGPAELLEAMGKPDAAFTETVPAGERVSRDSLIAAANKYFDSIEHGSADAAAFDKDCNRVENGDRVTNNPSRPAANLTWNPWALGCAEQINTRIFSSYQRIYPRRFPVVDEERQLVFGFFMYQQPGDILSVESPGHGVYKMPDSATTPGFTESAQLFRIKAGKIRKIESLTLGIPYGMPNPFFKDDWRSP